MPWPEWRLGKLHRQLLAWQAAGCRPSKCGRRGPLCPSPTLTLFGPEIHALPLRHRVQAHARAHHHRNRHRHHHARVVLLRRAKVPMAVVRSMSAGMDGHDGAAGARARSFSSLPTGGRAGFFRFHGRAGWGRSTVPTDISEKGHIHVRRRWTGRAASLRAKASVYIHTPTHARSDTEPGRAGRLAVRQEMAIRVDADTVCCTVQLFAVYPPQHSTAQHGAASTRGARSGICRRSACFEMMPLGWESPGSGIWITGGRVALAQCVRMQRDRGRDPCRASREEPASQPASQAACCCTLFLHGTPERRGCVLAPMHAYTRGASEQQPRPSALALAQCGPGSDPTRAATPSWARMANVRGH